MNRMLLALPLLATAACSIGPIIPSSDGGITFVSSPEPTDTGTVATASLFPSMSAGSDENGIHVWAAFPFGTSFLQLGADDSLTATVDGVTQALQLDPTDSNAHYTATFPRDDAAARVTISFVRANGQASAPSTVVPLGPAFTATAPTTFLFSGQPDAAPVDATLTVQWSPAPTSEVDLEYRVNGTCLPSGVAGVDRPIDEGSAGSERLDLGAILDPTAQGCTVAVELREETRGVWDPAFNADPNANVLQGVQSRTIVVTQNPSANEDAGGATDDGGVSGG